jgi:methyl-accepting chemotaxis protein
MLQPTRFSLRLFTLTYFGSLVLLAGVHAAITLTEDAPLWPGLIVSGCLAVLGIGLCMYLNRTVVQPAASLAAFANDTLKGNYGSGDTIPNSPLSAAVKELVARYKERLGFAHSILNGLPMPICIVDTKQHIQFLNKECLEMIGSTKELEYYHGKMISQIFYNDDRKSKIADCMDTDTRAMNLEAVFKHVDGSDINVLANLFPLHDVEDKVIGGCCVYLVTTELKRHEAEIVSQNERIAKAALDATKIAGELASATEQLQVVVRKAKSGTHIQTERIDETATAMEEMNATVMEVARHSIDAAEGAGEAREKAGEGAAIVTQVVSAIHEVATHADGLRSSMEELDNRSEAIGKVLSVIEDIADQTNLLALNAAIEAARAGDAGRGFAVVADEVRKLAEKTMDATREVHAAITGIQEGARENVKATMVAVESVNRSTEMAGRSGETLNAIVTMADTTADRVRSIATAAEQQSTASEEINRATMDISAVCNETDQLMTDASEAVDRLSRMAESLNSVIREME